MNHRFSRSTTIFVQAAAERRQGGGRQTARHGFHLDGRRRKDASQGRRPKVPAHARIGNESGAQLKPRNYGQVGAVMSGRDKIHVLRIWVKRPAGWRLLVYHEVALGQQAATAARAWRE